jgi:hypothetical protein
MKKRNEVISALIPLVITLSLYLVFYTRIECKPSHAGFWLILALGASIGVAITRFSQRALSKKD